MTKPEVHSLDTVQERKRRRGLLVSQAFSYYGRACKGREEIRRGQCINEEMEPGDLARMALFLAADDSRMITSEDVMVTGGWS